jgi:hypothetical protein
LEYVVRDGNPLRSIKLPQAHEELLVTVLGVQLSLHEEFTMS